MLVRFSIAGAVAIALIFGAVIGYGQVQTAPQDGSDLLLPVNPLEGIDLGSDGLSDIEYPLTRPTQSPLDVVPASESTDWLTNVRIRASLLNWKQVGLATFALMMLFVASWLVLATSFNRHRRRRYRRRVPYGGTSRRSLEEVVAAVQVAEVGREAELPEETRTPVEHR